MQNETQLKNYFTIAIFTNIHIFYINTYVCVCECVCVGSASGILFSELTFSSSYT